jgi:hypothetical protein
MTDKLNAVSRYGTNAGTDRAAYRTFVREHHPDRGGDVDAFVAGLARFRSAGVVDTSVPAPARHQPADRYDAPVIGVVRPRGVNAVAHRFLRWWRRRVRRSRIPRVR